MLFSWIQGATLPFSQTGKYSSDLPAQWSVLLSFWKWKCSVAQRCPTSLWPHGLWSTRLLCPWKSPGQNTGVGGHSLLQGIFPTQGRNPGVLHCRQILYHLSHQGSPLSFWGGCQRQPAHSTLSPRWHFRFVDRTASMPFHPKLRAWLQKYVCTKKLSSLPGFHRLDKIIQ